jgi:hypothetical protein
VGSVDGAVDEMKVCLHCGRGYNWRRSTSRFLKMTYCSQMDEAMDGCTIEDLLNAKRDEVKAEVRRMVRMFRDRYERPMSYWELFKEMSKAGAL